MYDFQRPWIGSLDELQREMERYLSHISQRKPRSVVFSERTWQPAVDVYETKDSVVALVDLAGVPEEEIQLVVARDALTVKGERRDTAVQRDRTYTCLEIPFGPFQRTVALPAGVNPEAATASYKAGFLEITMPKLSALRPHRISVGE